MGRHDLSLTLGEEVGGTKIRDRSALSGFSVCSSSGGGGRPPFLFSHGLLSPKHIVFMQEKEIPPRPVQGLGETSDFLLGSDTALQLACT